MKKILKSLLIVGIVGLVVGGFTYAYFNDTEKSEGNTFTAGAIDLKIDNESYVTDKTGVIVKSTDNSWGLDDLDGNKHLFFSFADLKPGDIGEDTISLHVYNNDAYACMGIKLTGTPENSQNEPELAVPDTTLGTDEGELQDELYFAFWNDDGDNVYEADEVIFKEGLAKDLFDGKYWTLADTRMNVWTQAPPRA